ncbi:MAG: hypothetical protein HFI67_12020 [Lachnospiraceae bacterium]|jgi:hypothetical protein|nr:hypothetical protein [Lachnospiraceae bacterium]
MREELLEELKRYLPIAYDDEETDAFLESVLERGKAILDDYAGTPQDYGREGLAKQLLFDFCRYVRSHAEEMFEINFRRDLIALRETAEREYYEDQDTDRISDL